MKLKSEIFCFTKVYEIQNQQSIQQFYRRKSLVKNTGILSIKTKQEKMIGLTPEDFFSIVC